MTETTRQLVGLLVGAGCQFSDYSALPRATDTEPSYRLELDPGLGKGIYMVKFSYFNLPEEDVLILRASDATKTLTPIAALSGKNATGKFFSTGIVGTGIVLELVKATTSINSTSCRGFTVSELLYFPFKLVADAHVELEMTLKRASDGTKSIGNDNDESVCGSDESVEAACAIVSDKKEEGATMLAKARSVARLSIIKENGMQIAYCTGWLIGCEGHLITNEHCISNSQDALNTKVEFLAESSTCSIKESCETRGGCPGPVDVAGTTLVAVSEDLDYALVRLGINDTNADFLRLYNKTGFLQFRGSKAKMNESIYIPHHPLGFGKRISWLYNGQPGRVESLTVTKCRKDDIGYYIDTQEGTSGSPIIAKKDNDVIALHHCGGCLNGGIPAPLIIKDLIKKKLLPKCAVAGHNKTTKTS
ncbi:serine protease v8 [Plasmopara halstedii]|uniref:Serine protease v8 n=1 Tax=Plasmopara halstedii TaxID=4781 RepID=A0A0P1AY33_PLAHL|nr:serine protease v8 [Plasmopara halstedii]CEG46606.1 serine protease v8 [Plasmopara halstedii]|eukprot:XP_024582975.1 serine protease v8 [Plasmopara halstedii]